MFITIKKSTIIICFVAVCIIVSGAIVYAKKKPKVIPETRIIVDAGHGGMDGGAVGYAGTLEKEINLKVATRLKNLLEAGGATVHMTREEDVSLHDESAKSVREQKRSDLSKRRDMAMDSETDIFISVHMNKFEQSQYRGAQIFYADNEKSRILADKIRERIIPVSEKSDGRELKQAYNTMYILNGTQNPAVIVECGFLSNPEEEQLLCDEEYQQKIAEAIYNGVCDFILSEKESSKNQ